jgi:hypothetical protein
MTVIVQIEETTIKQQCKILRMPVIASQCVPVAEQAVREKRTYLNFLEALLAAELERRERSSGGSMNPTFREPSPSSL